MSSAETGTAPVVIDGSMLEGGGQILRNALAISAITNQAVRIEKIRAGRSKPGLRPQHAAGLKLVADLCGGHVEGGEVGSSTSLLQPGKLRTGSFTAEAGTAGSCMLMAQASLPCAIMSPSQFASSGQIGSGADQPTTDIKLRGGTDAAMAPPFGYSEHVLLPMLRQLFGLQVDMVCKKRGFFPKGGGVICLEVVPLPSDTHLQPITLTNRGSVTSISIEAISCGRMKVNIAERMADAAVKVLKKDDPSLRGVPISINAWQPEAVGDGGSIVITAETDTGCIFGASALAERGVTSEDVGRKAAEEMVEALSTGGCVDEWLQDQLIIFMALAKGRSTVLCGEPTLHTRTAIAVAEQLTAAKFQIQQQPVNPRQWLITCDGAAISPETQLHN